MAAGQQVLKLGETTYAMHRMGPIQAVEFAPKVGQMIAKALGTSDWQSAIRVLKDLSGMEREGLEQKIMEDPALIMDIVKTVLPTIAGTDLELFTALGKEALAHEVYAEDKKLASDVNFTDHFTKHPGNMLAVMAWATWEHAKPFLSGSGQNFLTIFAG